MKIRFLYPAIPLVLVLAPGLPSAFAAGGIDEEVIVTATRSPFSLDKTPYSVRVIDRQQIKRSAAATVEEVLRGEGSLQIRDSVGNGRDVRVSVRAMSGGQNAAILVDGRRLNNSDLSGPDLAAVALQDVERIEVLEGGAGVLFGDQAVGGVINIITRSGGEPGGEVVVGAGSYSARNLGFNYRGEAAQEALDYRLSAQRDTADGYRDGTDLAYDTVRGEAGYSYDGGRVFLEVQGTESDYLLPGALVDAQREEDRRQGGGSFNDYSTESASYRAGLHHRFSGSAELFVAYGKRDEEVAILANSRSFGSSRTDQKRDVETLDPRLVLSLGKWRLILGSDIEHYDYELMVNSSFGASASEHRHERRSGYLQGIYSFSENLQLSAGYRHAEVDVDVDGDFFTADYDDAVSVSQMGLSYRINDNLRTYINRSETFRFPLADENVDFLGNVVALDSQKGVAWEVGGGWRQNDLELGLVFFDHAIENEIGYDTSLFANINFDDTRRRGATFDSRWQLSGGVSVAASLTRMSAEFEAGPLDGNRLPDVAELLAGVALNWDLTEALRLFAEAVYTGPMAVDLRGMTNELPGYTVYNLAATYEIDSWLIKGRINNLFGKEYSELVTFFGTPAYYPSPAENARVSIQYRF